MEGVRGEIRRFLAEKLGAGAPAPFRDDASLVSSDLVDSTMVVELAAFLEARFGVEVRDEDLTLDNLDSVAAIAAFIERKRVAAPVRATA